MKTGEFEIYSIDTGIFHLDGGAMFGVIPKVMWSRAYHEGDEKNRIPLAARPLLIKRKNQAILVDAGNGTKMNEKLRSIYGIDNEKSDIELALAKYGLKADDITDVIITHLHFDHAGGLTKYVDGKPVPVFENARHYIQKAQLDWANNPTDKDKASYIPDNWKPLENDGMLISIDGPGEIFPGISLITVDGHTKAMQTVKIDSGEGKFLYSADLAPTSAHVKPVFVLGYDNEPLKALEEKKKYFTMAAEDDWTIIYEHDAFTTASKIEIGERGIKAVNKFDIND